MMTEAPVFRDDVAYTVTGEWAKRSGEYARVGIDDYSQSALGAVVFVDLPELGTRVRAGQPFGSLEATKTAIDLNAPLSGLIVRVNRALEDSPFLVNADPFGKGWMVEISPSNPLEWEILLDVEDYKARLRERERG